MAILLSGNITGIILINSSAADIGRLWYASQYATIVFTFVTPPMASLPLATYWPMPPLVATIVFRHFRMKSGFYVPTHISVPTRRDRQIAYAKCAPRHSHTLLLLPTQGNSVHHSGLNFDFRLSATLRVMKLGSALLDLKAGIPQCYFGGKGAEIPRLL